MSAWLWGVALLVSVPTGAAAAPAASVGAEDDAPAPAPVNPRAADTPQAIPWTDPMPPPVVPAPVVSDPSIPPVASTDAPVGELIEKTGETEREAQDEAATKKREQEEKDPERLEYGVLPAINYDSDLGFGFGLVGTLAKFHPGYRPYKWRLELLLYATLKRRPGGGVEIPFHDDYLDMDFPGLLNNRLRVRAIVGFQKQSNIGYYGLGSAAVAEEPWLEYDPEKEEEAYKRARRYHQFDRTFPYGDVFARINVWDRSTPVHKRRLEVFVGAGFSYNFIALYPQSNLENDHLLAQEDSADGRAMASLLHGTRDHAFARASTGLLIDTRDHEFTPTRGTFTEISVRGSPGVDEQLHFAAFAINSSWYRSIYKEWLSFAVRGVGDFMIGNPPIWSLSRFGAFLNRPGPGGAWSVRGVPRQRFAGKIKLIGNFEFRSMFAKFRIKKQRFQIGAVAFADTGRVWADYRRVIINDRPLDGDFTDWSLGLGGGLRVKWGETFIVRVDVGHSVTVSNTGVYILIGHVF